MFFRNKFFTVFEGKETDACSNIVIIKFIINLISRHYYTSSACDCISEDRKFFGAQFGELEGV